MTVTVLPRLPMTKAIKAALAAELGTGFPVGLGRVPVEPDSGPAAVPDSQVPADPPYVVLYPLWVSSTRGPEFAAPDADATWVYQVTMVSQRTDQLEWMRDKVIAVFLARLPAPAVWETDFTTAAMKVTDRRIVNDTGLPEPDQLPLYSDIQFGVSVTPA